VLAVALAVHNLTTENKPYTGQDLLEFIQSGYFGLSLNPQLFVSSLGV
jgi:hypothetical protein